MSKYLKPTVENVALFFIKKMEKEGQHLDIIKIDKLVHYSYLWYLHFTNEHMFKNSKNGYKETVLEVWIYSNQNNEILLQKELNFRPEVNSFLEEIFNKYGIYSGDQLISLMNSDKKKGNNDYT
jgi:uncharacterized phage-associated protein